MCPIKWVFPGDDKKKFFLWWRIQKGGKSLSPTRIESTGRKRNWFSNFAEFLVLFRCERDDIGIFCPCDSLRTFDSFYSLCCVWVGKWFADFSSPQLFILQLIRMSQLSSASLRHRCHIGWRQTSWCHSQLDEVIRIPVETRVIRSGNDVEVSLAAPHV